MNSRNPYFDIPSFGEVSVNLDLEGISYQDLLRMYKIMTTIRKFEIICADNKKNNEIGGPVHLAIGQEAIPVGISQHLNVSDSIFSAHRSHAHLLALGSEPKKIFAEILGRRSGVSGGFGGSMHLIDKSVGFQGSVPIVAATVPLSLGTAFAAKSSKNRSISVCYFGDGAIEEGVVHESLNLATLLNLPVLFVCENNYMASHMHLSERQNLDKLSRFAEANGIESKRLDGNDVATIFKDMQRIIQRIRKTRQPYFVELMTFRHLGHVDWREDIDVGVARSKQEVQNWKRIDPLIRLKNTLTQNEIFHISELDKIESEIELSLKKDWLEANSEMTPQPESILRNVFISNLGIKNAD